MLQRLSSLLPWFEVSSSSLHLLHFSRPLHILTTSPCHYVDVTLQLHEVPG